MSGAAVGRPGRRASGRRFPSSARRRRHHDGSHGDARQHGGDFPGSFLRILSVEPATEPVPADRGQPFDAHYPGSPAAAPASSVMDLPGSVKFFDPARGFGFVVPDSGGREVYVHSSVLFRSGMTDLAPGQRVFVRAESVPRGLQATDIEPL